jgi:hypothetical protein
VAYHLSTIGLPAFPAVCLLIVPEDIRSLPLPLSPVHFQHSHTLCCVLVFSSLFIVQCVRVCAHVCVCVCVRVCVCVVGGQSAQGAILVYPVVAEGTPRHTWCSPVWSAKCLPGRFGAGCGGGGGSPPVFSV